MYTLQHTHAYHTYIHTYIHLAVAEQCLQALFELVSNYREPGAQQPTKSIALLAAPLLMRRCSNILEVIAALYVCVCVCVCVHAYVGMVLPC
jgi:hypothetical protein